MVPEDVKQDTIEFALTGLNGHDQVAHRLAIESGAKDEICPRCDRIFFAHEDSSVIRNCQSKPCFYSLSELEARGIQCVGKEKPQILKPIEPCEICDSRDHDTGNCPGM